MVLNAILQILDFKNPFAKPKKGGGKEESKVVSEKSPKLPLKSNEAIPPQNSSTPQKVSSNPQNPASSKKQPQNPKGNLPQKAATKTKGVAFKKSFFLFADELPVQAMVVDVDFENKRYVKLVKLVRLQSYVILSLVIFIILTMPLFEPVYRYFVRNPMAQIKSLVALNAPNLTNSAVISWATNSVVEILTLGFGDFDSQVGKQYFRFTREGWISFLTAAREMNLREIFKSHQLVLTTVPSDTPVIIFQGNNEDNEYQWILEMPVIMTYSTNMNVNQKESHVARLTLVRVPTSQNDYGIAIKQWVLL